MSHYIHIHTVARTKQRAMDGTAEGPTWRGQAFPQNAISSSSLTFNQPFITSPKGLLLVAEIVFGLVVWILVGGTDYLLLPALCWVTFVSILCWILTLCLFIIFLTGAHSRAPQIPWTTLSLCVNASATVLYLIAAVINAFTMRDATRGRHTYKCWAASTCFAFLTTLCYTSSSFLSFQDWRSTPGTDAVL
uniref:CKLF-like MARVEL transmembrane domain containing 8b n=1 Tax=Neogobius melanostomus TaxID=47308 RepID=A0A8C6WYC9_9GOBI